MLNIFSTLLQFCQTIADNSQFSIKLGTVGKLCEYLLLCSSNPFTFAKKNFIKKFIINYQCMNLDQKLFFIILDQRKNIELLLSGIPKNAKSWCFPCHFEIQQVLCVAKRP